MLDVRRLKVLQEVAARGSFSAAAQALDYTQSAVSQHIAALEREVGTQLVERRPRGLLLTQAGEALVRHAEVIFARIADAEAELEALAGLRAGSVCVAAFPSVGASLVPAAVAAFRTRHPDVRVHLALAEPPDALAALRAGEHDVAMTIDDYLADGLELTHLLDDPVYIALPIGHPLARRRRIGLVDLAEEPWLLGAGPSCPDQVLFRSACREAGFEPRVAIESDDYNAIQGFVASGVGVALIPDLALVNVRDDILIRPVAGGGHVRRIFAATRPGGATSPAARAMVETLVETARGYVATRRAGRALAVA